MRPGHPTAAPLVSDAAADAPLPRVAPLAGPLQGWSPPSRVLRTRSSVLNPLYPELARFLRASSLTAQALFSRHDRARAQALTFTEAAGLLREACPSAGERAFVREFLSAADADGDGLVRAADIARAVAPGGGAGGAGRGAKDGEGDGGGEEEWLPAARELSLNADGSVGDPRRARRGVRPQSGSRGQAPAGGGAAGGTSSRGSQQQARRTATVPAAGGGGAGTGRRTPAAGAASTR